MLTGGEAGRKAANELLEVTQFEKVMDDTINAAAQVVQQMDPKMSGHEAQIKAFYKKYMGADTLRDDVIDLYAEIFTEAELKDIIAFYKTKAGRKTLEKVPEIMQRSMQLAQTRIMQNMGELEKMLSEVQASE
jgi:hypothetical protein